MRAASGAQLPLTFEQLLGLVVRAGLIDRDQARDLHSRQVRQLNLLRAERRERAATARKGQRELHGDVTPIEHLASFEVACTDGRPLSEDLLTELYAQSIGLPYVKLDPLELDASFVTSIVSKAFARKHDLLPIKADAEALTLATCNPTNTVALESVERVVRKPLRLVITARSDIQRLIGQLFGFQRSVAHAERDLSERIDLGNLEQFVRMQSEREIEASDRHVVNAVEYLFQHAVQQRASDIHVEPKRDQCLVRFRIDGTLHLVHTMPMVVHRAVINRIKNLARLDIGEKRRPQDGRIRTEIHGKRVELRVSTLAVAFGEKAVLRIFDPEIAESSLTDLGFFERDLALFERLMRQPHGIILVTGPTGSGKTTTLYTALRALATEEVNVTTIEDPIEIVFEGINQTAVQPAIGMTFAESLKTILRQDPDVIMVGEIRDGETAHNAVQAALTGHVVFSTLHTNDAPSAITRMRNLGLPSYLLASTLLGLVAQRLVRKICALCMEERSLTDTERRILAVDLPDEPVTVPYGAGCVDCRQTGYRGRSAIYELFEVNEPIVERIVAEADAGEIRRQAQREGMTSLRQAAIRKMLEGVTSFEEVLRVTGQR